MSDTILVALLTCGTTLLGTFLSGLFASKKAENSIKIQQAITREQITELTREVREHNNFAKRVPLLELKVGLLESKMKGGNNDD